MKCLVARYMKFSHSFPKEWINSICNCENYRKPDLIYDARHFSSLKTENLVKGLESYASLVDSFLQSNACVLYPTDLPLVA